MNKITNYLARFMLLCLLVPTSAVFADHNDQDASEFDDLFINVETNVTDGDTEIIFGAKPDSDDGLKKFEVVGPHGQKIVKVKSPRAVLGLREFSFESPEPPGDSILALYPEGEYTFTGKSTNNEVFYGVATLSHELPMPAVVTFPAQDAVVSADAITIEWSQVPDADQIILELEIESEAIERTLLINLPAGTTSFVVPPSMLVGNADYQIGIGTVGENGNISFAENQFSTE